MKRISAAVITAVCLAGVTACGVGPEPSTAPLTETSKAADEKPAASPTPSQTAQQTASLSGTAPVGETETVKISGIKRGVTNQYGDPENTAYVKFTVTMTNKGDAAIDPMMLMISCAYGDLGTAADEVWYEGRGEPPMVKVLPGKSTTFDHACTMPKDVTTLTIQVQDVNTGEAAVFEGEVK